MDSILFTKESLYNFICSEQYARLINVPISKHRAISQINNPRADKDDILLIAQFDENKTIGYLGILPDYIFIGNNKEKIGWLSCFWVDEEYRSQNIAAILFLKAMKAYNEKIFITNIVPWLEPIYQKTKLFFPTKYQSGFRGYLRFNLSGILPSKNKLFQKFGSLFKLSDCLFNSVADLRFTFNKKRHLPGINYDYLTSLNEIPDEFIEKYITDNWTRRSKTELNWIVKNPWLIEGIEKDIQSSKYYFSYISSQFFTQIIRFSNNANKPIGILIINVRNRNLTMPYLFCDKENLGIVAKFIIYTMVSLKLNMVTLFHEDIASYFFQIKTPFIFRKKIKKSFFISKKFEAIDKLNFQDGDGDCAFY